MIKVLITILCIIGLSADSVEDYKNDRIWMAMTDEQRYEAPIELKARAVGMNEEEFELMSRVVYAESDRSSLDGMILIALTIYNRVESDSWPDTVSGVCNQSGQFSVVSSGAIWSAGRTNQSDWAIIEAHRQLADGSAPGVMWFNNSGYCHEPYACVGGNYFSC